MRRLTTRRRAVTTALALTMLLALPAGVARAVWLEEPIREANASNRPGALQRLPDWICNYPWRDGQRQVEKLIRCASERWQVPGGSDRATEIAKCESGFNPDAYNPAGFAGVFQQSTRYWPGRAASYGFPDDSVFNGRANVIVSIRMAHAQGWGAWGCG